ncbi:MAG: ATP-binding protein [Crenarchaeota archaeon]|mgnify:CR=1 FL=1|nr:MAG: ATP-binding protein [Thermoproteota archaeon]RDJ32935.1 MAG: ATP-binding protein [Thermoproteota archaeon]RDJ38230.1 MAG: ATP-binding protein [Thermoproteota archaeon]
MIIGYVIGESKPTRITALASRALSIGEYVIINSDEGKILGLVERSYVSSVALSDVRNFDEAVESKEIAEINKRDKGYTSQIMILGFLDKLQKGQSIVPAIPPLPGTEILEASKKDLEKIFGPDGNEWIRIGSLLRNPEIDAKININKIVARHVGILAMTGMGKSNLVSLLAKQIDSLSGTVIIFDYHDDYSNLAIPRINVIDAKINPRLLDAESLGEVLEIRDNASIQQRILRMAFTKQVKESKDFWMALNDQVEEIIQLNKKDKKEYTYSGGRVQDKIDDAQHKFSDILDPDVVDPIGLIKEGRINVLNISSLSEKQANVAVSYYLQELLNDRKESIRAKNAKQTTKRSPRFGTSIFVVIEEAHVFIPKGEDTQAKYWASKIAREGRKFGLGLAVVSQRPRSLDPNILSQMGSLAIMKIVQEDDQSQITSAAESISKNLIEQLTSLNVGDAILVGQWANLPSIVHIQEVKEKTRGADQNAVTEWAVAKKFEGIAKESTQKLIQKDLLVD